MYRSGETVLLARGRTESGAGSRDGSRTAGPWRQYPPSPQRGLASVRWTLVLVACACLGLFLATGRAEAQQPPGAPTIGSVTAGTNTLTISWTASTDGGAAITAYDLQYIRTDDDETDPANWTLLDNVWTTTGGGTLQRVVGDLLDGLSYDLQVRARNSEGSGDWSDTHAASTNDHDVVTSRSSLVPLGSSLPGYIASGADADTFRVSVPPGGGYLWVYTTGEVDTNGVLAAGNRDILDRNEDGWLPHGVRNFSIRYSVYEGTYYFRVQRQRGSTGAYRVHARLVTLPGATAATAQNRHARRTGAGPHPARATPVGGQLLHLHADRDDRCRDHGERVRRCDRRAA